MPRIASPRELEEFRTRVAVARDQKGIKISLCCGSACQASGSGEVVRGLEEVLSREGIDDQIEIKKTGCQGFCQGGPLMVIHPQGICYVKVKPEDVYEIVDSTVRHGKLIERLLYQDPYTGKKIVQEAEIPFYKNQQRLISGANVLIDPTSLEDYIAIGGYSALAKVLSRMTPVEVIEEIKRSGLRGRGGAGFPTGRKWEEARKALGDIKYVIVNADEGDPGAYMDGALMEGNPHSVLEGLIIGGYAVGAHQGYVYVRQEYPVAVKHISLAIERAMEYGLLGYNILGSGFDFEVRVHRGAGAFVSGESSALMTAIEGRVGEPRPKYIHTVVKGIWDRPSVLNNVETWANVPLIINRGAQWYSQIGTQTSTGTKIFSVVGKIRNTGLVEVPMGTTLREIIYDIGGGIPGGKRFKAVQTGGPSGGCVPEEFLDLPVGFDELTEVGSMMGSGGMIVMDEDTCMVDVARYFLNFLTEESCGKCVPCREGITHMLGILSKITEGRGEERDLAILEDLAFVAQEASLCGLGKTAPNPLVSTMRYFKEEYEAHIFEKRCPALACKELVYFYIDPGKCQACMICLRNCPSEAIQGGKKLIHVIDQGKCTKCGTCFEVCPEKFGAVRKISGQRPPEPIPPGDRVLAKKGKKA